MTYSACSPAEIYYSSFKSILKKLCAALRQEYVVTTINSIYMRHTAFVFFEFHPDLRYSSSETTQFSLILFGSQSVSYFCTHSLKDTISQCLHTKTQQMIWKFIKTVVKMDFGWTPFFFCKLKALYSTHFWRLFVQSFHVTNM